MTGRLEWPDPTPYDEDPEQCDACEYDEFDDWNTGRVRCIHCDRTWYLTLEQIKADNERALAVEEEQARGFDPAAYRRAMIGDPTTEPLKDDELPF